jgi:P27 family predicted phage terminase small subunit
MPARKTTHAKKMAGSRTPTKDYPRLAAYLPREPRWMDLLGNKRTAADARKWWRETVPVLHAAGVLSVLDETLVVEAAICHARIRECERELGRTGLLVDGARGGVVRNPIVMALSSYRQSLKTYLRELGLSPMSRQSLDVPSQLPGKVSPLKLIQLKQACWRAGVTHIDWDAEDWDLDVPPDIWDEVMGGHTP